MEEEPTDGKQLRKDSMSGVRVVGLEGLGKHEEMEDNVNLPKKNRMKVHANV